MYYKDSNKMPKWFKRGLTPPVRTPLGGVVSTCVAIISAPLVSVEQPTKYLVLIGLGQIGKLNTYQR